MIDLFIDTREQKELEFKADYINSVSKATMKYGDYGARIDGIKVPVVFERKSINDLFGTLGKGHARFKKEINRSIEDNCRLIIIIEKPLTTVVKGIKRSKMKGIAVARTLFTYMIKHGIPFVCCKNREEMSLYISEFYRSWEANIGK